MTTSKGTCWVAETHSQVRDRCVRPHINGLVELGPRMPLTHEGFSGFGVIDHLRIPRKAGVDLEGVAAVLECAQVYGADRGGVVDFRPGRARTDAPPRRPPKLPSRISKSTQPIDDIAS
jgi:hypothetical protein